MSVGQSQLLCVCRALIRESPVVLVDEATAHVDYGTDTLIQRVLRREFRGRTVLMIAHRLNTVQHCDRIMVLEQGRIVEFDTPKRLAEAPGSFIGQRLKALFSEPRSRSPLHA